ncbi:peptidylprolyl isomerase [Paenibacillus nanensis]|uniref:Peptidylprolyl isomerase n=1 Tax=Paenibacillus nanensis TaxID=393251 RepID=A0A3A1VIU7_9BACL|nr:peptidylprolyl isomerase [Paenibacillus nanensis]RIX60234.1 peptidylprolyl isomerase [Paenibacillus nanensis]
MNNKESQTNGNPIDNEEEKKDRYAYEENQDETEQAAVSEQAGEFVEPDKTAAAETAAAAAPIAAVAGAESAPPSKKGGAVGWIVLSSVLVIALIVVLIKPPFGGGSGGESVATVNGKAISQDELFEAMKKTYGESSLETLITKTLVQQEADAAGIKITEQDVTDEIDLIKLDFGSEDEFNNILAQNNLTVEDLREDMRINAMVRKVLESKTDVTDEEIQTYFDENQGKLGGSEEQVRASHILVATKEEADAILADLKAGADFAETAKAKSTDGSAANGGDLDFFTKTQMVEPFAEAAFALEVGEISDVVQSEFGYHIIKKTDYKPATEANFDEKKDLIRMKLVSDEVNQLASPWIEEIRAKAKITNKLTEEEPAASEAPASETATETKTE